METIKKKRRSNTVPLTIFCLPAAICIFVFAYLPLGGLILAFKEYRYDKGIFGSDWVGLNNFKFFFFRHNIPPYLFSEQEY